MPKPSASRLSSERFLCIGWMGGWFVMLSIILYTQCIVQLYQATARIILTNYYFYGKYNDMSEKIAPNLIIDGDPIQPVGAVDYLDTTYIPHSEIAAEHRFQHQALVDKLGSLATGDLVLLPPEISGIQATVDDQHIRSHSLNHVPGLERGRQHSRAEVAFGQLHLAQPEASTITELVAVKYVHPITASREFLAAKAVNERFGEHKTYTPLGFIRAEDTPRGAQRVGVLTRYEHNVNTLDNYLWNPNTPAETRRAMYQVAGRAMAELHNHGFIHGDAQAKNFALDSRGAIRHLDTETYTDIRYSHDATIGRLGDVSNMFDPQTLTIAPDIEDIGLFVDSYMDTQTGTYGKLEDFDIQDVISQTRGDDIGGFDW